MHLAAALCNNRLNTRLLAECDGHNAGLKVACHSDYHYVNATYTELTDNLGVGDVGALAYRKLNGSGVYPALVIINGDNLHTACQKLLGHGGAVSAKTEYCVSFINTHF